MPLKDGFEALGPVACPLRRFEGQHRIAIGVIDFDNTFCADDSDLEPVDSTLPYCMALDLHATYYEIHENPFFGDMVLGRRLLNNDRPH